MTRLRRLRPFAGRAAPDGVARIAVIRGATVIVPIGNLWWPRSRYGRRCCGCTKIPHPAGGLRRPEPFAGGGVPPQGDKELARQGDDERLGIRSPRRRTRSWNHRLSAEVDWFCRVRSTPPPALTNTCTKSFAAC